MGSLIYHSIHTHQVCVFSKYGHSGSIYLPMYLRKNCVVWKCFAVGFMDFANFVKQGIEQFWYKKYIYNEKNFLWKVDVHLVLRMN